MSEVSMSDQADEQPRPAEQPSNPWGPPPWYPYGKKPLKIGEISRPGGVEEDVQRHSK
jgi:hypothetical protein